MRKLILTALTLITILFSIHSIAAAYTIYLKNGKVIKNAMYVTPRKNFIYFVIEGKEDDLLKVKKSAVDRIETSRGSVFDTQDRSKNAPPKQVVTNVSKGGSQNPIARIPRDKAKTDIKTELAQRYSGSFSTQNLLLKSNMKSYDYLSTLPSNKVNNQILGNLIQRYYPNFTTIKTLYKSNLKAYRELNK
jgi:hypothetical protein